MRALLLLILLSPAAAAQPLDDAADELAASVRAGYALQRSTQPATLLVSEFKGTGGVELSYLLRVKLASAPFALLHPDSVEASSADLRLTGAVLEKTAVVELWDGRSGRVLAAGSSLLGPPQAPPPADSGTFWGMAGTIARFPVLGPYGSAAWRTPRGRWEAAVDVGGFAQETWDSENHGSAGWATSHYSDKTRFVRAKVVRILPVDGVLPGLALRAGAGLGAYMLEETRSRRGATPGMGMDTESTVTATKGSLLLEAGLAYRLAPWLEAQAGAEYATESGSTAAHLHYGRFSVKGGLAARLFPPPAR